MNSFKKIYIYKTVEDVTLVGLGGAVVQNLTTLGLKSKGQSYQTFIEKKLSTSTYYLLGNTKV